MGVFVARPVGRAQFGRIFPPDFDWLARQAVEDVLEPDLPIVDTHHHLWDMSGDRYLIHELQGDLASGHRVVATVYAEALAMYRATGPVAMRPVGETEFVSGVAAMSASGLYGPARIASGIVGFADLARGAGIEPVLRAHIAAGGGRFRGVRYAGGWDADPTIGNSHNLPAPGMLRSAGMLEGLRCLQSLGLSFDALVYHPQLQEVAALAASLPELSIVLEHTGMPLGYGVYAGRRDEVFAVWKAGIAQVAKHPNVSVKLGGLVMRLAAFDYVALGCPPDSQTLAGYWRPYIETCIELFGERRCMFESNFPVDRLGTGYRTLWNAFKRITQGCSAAQKHLLYCGNAQRIYRLDPD